LARYREDLAAAKSANMQTCDSTISIIITAPGLL
jgi:hypothetical protein